MSATLPAAAAAETLGARPPRLRALIAVADPAAREALAGWLAREGHAPLVVDEQAEPSAWRHVLPADAAFCDHAIVKRWGWRAVRAGLGDDGLALVAVAAEGDRLEPGGAGCFLLRRPVRTDELALLGAALGERLQLLHEVRALRATRPAPEFALVNGELRLKHHVRATEREIILRALERAGGNRREAARLLGVSVRTLFYKMRQTRLP